jgi:hypothetical protein
VQKEKEKIFLFSLAARKKVLTFATPNRTNGSKRKPAEKISEPPGTASF